MKKIIFLLPLMALSSAAQASTSYGALGNFDAVNDTGQTCYGFEIEIDDVHSTAIGGTYSYNHYGVPKIREDNTDTAHPKVFIRYEVTNPSGTDFGTDAGKTNVPTGVISPTSGHQCTNPGVNQGCEYFGVGIYSSSYSAVKYNWLIKDPNDPSGKTNTLGPAVNVGTPNWTYNPPVVPPGPNPVVIPANVVAVIPAPVVPQPVPKEFGEPSWVKVIKTTTHKVRPLALDDLVADDNDHDGHQDWTNGEPESVEKDDVESEWHLLQTNNNNNGKSELAGKADDMGEKGDETATRRYEFYAYGEDNDQLIASSIDGEKGEAMCDSVANLPDPDGKFRGVGFVTVTDANGNPNEFNCSSVVVVGPYRGAQMGAFNAAAPFGLIDKIQNINLADHDLKWPDYFPFPKRALPNGGNTPYQATISDGALPNGLVIESPDTGVLSGTPSKVGVFNFTVSASDSDGTHASQAYTVKVTGPGDVDVDSDIDSVDLSVIKAKNGHPAADKDPADVNGDLKINMADYRKAATLCTKPKCAIISPAP